MSSWWPFWSNTCYGFIKIYVREELRDTQSAQICCLRKRDTCFRILNCLFYPDNGACVARFISPSWRIIPNSRSFRPIRSYAFSLVYARTFPALLEFPSLLTVFLNRSEDHQVGHFPFPCTLSSFVFLFFLALFLSSPRQSPARLSVKLCMAAARFSSTRVRIARRRVEARSF